MRAYTIALIVLITTLGTAAGTAHADNKKQHRFVGIHPIPKPHGGGVCHIQAPHVHVFAPTDVKVQYRDHDGWSHFVGDPVAYGWDGPRASFYGHHPVPVHVVIGDDHDDTEYCYLDGAHYHAWTPPAGLDLDLELRGGAYWYTGTFPTAYAEAKVTYDPIDVVYQPIRYERPAITVEVAPPGWYGAVIVAPVVVVAPAPVVVAPRPRVRAEVVVPAPVLRLEIGVPSVHIGIGGGVVVHDHHRHGKKHKKHRGRGRGHR